MEVSCDPRQSAVLRGDFEPPPSVQTISVDVLCVPSILAALGWTELDLLKIDIEGGEVSVMGGRPDWLHHVKSIIGEGHLWIWVYDRKSPRRSGASGLST